MQKNKFLCVIVAFLLLGAALSPPALADGPDERILAQSIILTERESGTVLYAFNADEQRSPDSMVKLMTLLLAAEAIESGEAVRSELVTASESAFFDIDSSSETQGITAGEEMPLIDLMYCAYTGSGNEACNIIAEHIAGSVSDFVALMNVRARELGCRDTVFVNTHGQRDSRQYSTARDLARIAAAASKSYVFTEVAGAVSHTVLPTNTTPARYLTSVNHMLTESRARYYYRYAVFGKVSATYESGYGSVEYAEREGMALISVLLGSQAVLTEEGTIMQNLTEAKRLLEWGYASYSWQTALPAAQPVARVSVLHGEGADFVNLRPQSELRVLLKNTEEDAADPFTREITVFAERDGEALTAPVEEGSVLGELVLYQDGVEIGRVALVADTSVELRRISLLRQGIVSALGSLWFKLIVAVAAVLFSAYAVIVIRYNIIRAKRVKEVAARREELARQRRERDFDEDEWR